MVQEPTRVSRHSSSLIDHLVTNHPNRITHTAILSCSIVSDHDGIFACVNVRVERFKPRFKFIRYMKNFDDQAFVDDLEQAPFSLIYLSDDFQLDLLNSILVECIERHAPLRRVHLMWLPAPLMKTEEIQLLQAVRDRQMKAARRTHTAAAWDAFWNVRNKFFVATAERTLTGNNYSPIPFEDLLGVIKNLPPYEDESWTFNLWPVTYHEVFQALKTLRADCSTGPDLIFQPDS